MNFAKIKKWFTRHRNEGRLEEDHPDPKPRETKTRVNESGPAPLSAEPPSGPITGEKTPGEKRKRTRPAATESSSASPVSSRPISRQGIPILKPDDDLTAHFRDAAVDETHLGPAPGRVGVSDQHKVAGSPASRPPAASLRRNRVGIRRLDDDADLRNYFMLTPDDASEQKAPDPQQAARTQRPLRAALADVPTDRHGIPRLDDQADLNRLFDAAIDETDGGKALGETLRRSLDHDARGLMKEKTGGFFPSRRLSLKEKLRRYPSPQAQSDLHGATAAKARQRAEGFIRASRAKGLFTVRIIVGKGLHSEGGAVLPDVIEDLLMTLKREDLVLSYRWDKRIKRKSGAIIVYLTTDFH